MKTYVRRKKGHPPKRVSVMYYRDVPSDVATMFKAACAQYGESMLEVTVRLMKKFIDRPDCVDTIKGVKT